ncbi:hypothetical protein LCGC14_0503400 [marine sediment metagenome]|uniref:Uncharacterized protein n=1 Tax=marine sediment metagenome TaxID=412755 RepID=A0A0F9UQ62_9ZZZZ
MRFFIFSIHKVLKLQTQKSRLQIEHGFLNS